MNEKNCKGEFEKCVRLLKWCRNARRNSTSLTRHVGRSPTACAVGCILSLLRSSASKYSLRTLSHGLRDDFCSRFGFEHGICDIGHRFPIHTFHTIEAGAGGLVARTSRLGRLHRQPCSREAAEECSPRRKPWVARSDRSTKPRRGERNMSHTSGNILLHMIFSTQGRLPLIKSDFRADLFAFLGGIIREMDGRALIVNGTADHVHILLRIRARSIFRADRARREGEFIALGA